jgi:hypothetical protein
MSVSEKYGNERVSDILALPCKFQATSTNPHPNYMPYHK